MTKFQNHTAIITGGTSGIGLAVAQKLAHYGANIVIAGRDEKKGADAIANIKGIAKFVQTDVTDETQVADLINQTIKYFGKIDCLVNSAGITTPNESNFLKMPKAETESLISTLLTAPIIATQKAIPHLLSTKGSVINIASALGVKAQTFSPIYGSAKSGLIMFTKNMALMYAKRGVRFNAICPGPTDTPMLDNVIPNPIIKKLAMFQNPSRRAGTAEEVARLVAFVTHPDNSYITGSVYTIDGGQSL